MVFYIDYWMCQYYELFRYLDYPLGQTSEKVMSVLDVLAIITAIALGIFYARVIMYYFTYDFKCGK